MAYSTLNKDGTSVAAPSVSNEQSLELPNFPKSKQSANTLFHFMKKLDHLKTAVFLKKLYPRYCTEKYSFLPSGFPSLTFPMKCFCDIYLEKLDVHCSHYGSFGIGFDRDTMLAKGLQPIQYINQASDTGHLLHEKTDDFLKENGSDISDDFFYTDLFNRLKFTKPLMGEVSVNGKKEKKFLPDEKEWRYVPPIDTSSPISPFLTFTPFDIKTPKNKIEKASEKIEKKELYPLNFDYLDIKYLLVPGRDESKKLSADIWSLKVESSIKLELITKIIELDNIKDDM